MIYFTSDLHFNHDKDFIYRGRGFNSVSDMNEAIIYNWNRTVNAEDTVYVLGDLMLGDTEAGMRCINALNGEIRVILGNHDTDRRIAEYARCPKITDIKFADRLRISSKHSFYLSHYPVYVHNDADKPLWCLSGHTHSKKIFQEEFPCNYNVAVDAHECRPVSADEIMLEISNFRNLCKRQQ